MIPGADFWLLSEEKKDRVVEFFLTEVLSKMEILTKVVKRNTKFQILVRFFLVNRKV